MKAAKKLCSLDTTCSIPTLFWIYLGHPYVIVGFYPADAFALVDEIAELTTENRAYVKHTFYCWNN